MGMQQPEASPNESKILVVQMVVFKHEFSARPKSKNHFLFNLF